MRFWKNTIPLFVMAVKLVLSDVAPLFHAHWIQIYSNYYVQSTTQIDWKCVTVDTRLADGVVNVSTHALVHGLPTDKVTVTSVFNVSTEGNTTQLINKKEHLLVRDVTYKADDHGDEHAIIDYAILTASNNMSLYVWATNYSQFMEHRNAEVLRKLYEWDYIGLYKAPLFSYSTQCLNR